MRPTTDADQPRRAFRAGDRIFVTGGYDHSPRWLDVRDGYHGTLVAIEGSAALVELDEDMVLQGGEWRDFGLGSPTSLGTVDAARGRWIVLKQGSVGGKWTDPTGRLHVNLCGVRPRLEALPAGGGIGVWIESHATMTFSS